MFPNPDFLFLPRGVNEGNIPLNPTKFKFKPPVYAANSGLSDIILTIDLGSGASATTL